MTVKCDKTQISGTNDMHFVTKCDKFPYFLEKADEIFFIFAL